MKIVIIGLGTIGGDVLKTITNSNHDIAIIDEDKNLIDKYVENMMFRVSLAMVLLWKYNKKRVCKTLMSLLL